MNKSEYLANEKKTLQYRSRIVDGVTICSEGVCELDRQEHDRCYPRCFETWAGSQAKMHDPFRLETKHANTTCSTGFFANLTVNDVLSRFTDGGV